MSINCVSRVDQIIYYVDSIELLDNLEFYRDWYTCSKLRANSHYFGWGHGY